MDLKKLYLYKIIFKPHNFHLFFIYYILFIYIFIFSSFLDFSLFPPSFPKIPLTCFFVPWACQLFFYFEQCHRHLLVACYHATQLQSHLWILFSYSLLSHMLKLLLTIWSTMDLHCWSNSKSQPTTISLLCLNFGWRT